MMERTESYLAEKKQASKYFVLDRAREALFAKMFFFNTVVLYAIGHKDVYGKHKPHTRKSFKVSNQAP